MCSSKGLLTNTFITLDGFCPLSKPPPPPPTLLLLTIIRYSGPHFPAFELKKEIYGESFRIQSKCGKMRTRITVNMDIFHAVLALHKSNL